MLNEKIVYNRILCPDFWLNGEFDQKVRDKLLQIANDYYADLKVDAPILDIVLMGSLANYSWNEKSDLDIHIILDFSLIDDNIELVEEMMKGKKFIWKLRHPIEINGYDVELYCQDKNASTISSGIYSLLNDEWITKPTYKKPTIDSYSIAKKVEAYKFEIDKFNKILKTRRFKNARIIFDRLKLLKKKISGSRDDSLRRDGEFAAENLIFKELRNQGYIGKLIKLQAKAYSAIYSDPEYIPDESKIMQEKIKVNMRNTKRIVESYHNWVDNNYIINENLGSAKDFMRRHYAKKLQKQPRDMSPQEVRQSLQDPEYMAIVNILNGKITYINQVDPSIRRGERELTINELAALRENPPQTNPILGYAGPFIKFRFIQKRTFTDLIRLANSIRVNTNDIRKLPHDVDYYANTPEINGRSGFEALEDDLSLIIEDREVKWIVQQLPYNLRNQFRRLSEEEQKPLFDAAYRLNRVQDSKAVIKSVFARIKEMTDWDIHDAIEQIVTTADAYESKDMKERLLEIQALEPEVSVLYVDRRFLAVTPRTFEAQKKTCAAGIWCINSIEGYFEDYAGKGKIQINVFDLNEPPISTLFLTGSSLDYKGRVLDAFDRINSSLFFDYSTGYSNNKDSRFIDAVKAATRPVKQGKPGIHFTEHFKNLGYPDKLIHAVSSVFTTETAIKTLVIELKLDNTTTEDILKKILHITYDDKAFAENEVAANIVDNIIQGRIKNQLTREQVVSLYESQGVCSTYSLHLLKDLVPNPTAIELKGIIDRTIHIFKIARGILTNKTMNIDYGRLENMMADRESILTNLGVTPDAINTILEKASMKFQSYILSELGLKPKHAQLILENTITPAKPKTRPADPITKPKPGTKPGPIPSNPPKVAPSPKGDTATPVKPKTRPTDPVTKPKPGTKPGPISTKRPKVDPRPKGEDTKTSPKLVKGTAQAVIKRLNSIYNE